MLKKTILLVMVFMLANSIKADKEDFSQERGLLFCTTFDKRIVQADFAKGSRDAIGVDESLELRVQPGFDRECAYLRKEGERLEYDAKDNFSPQEGTVSFWFKADNWNPKGTSAISRERFKHLVSVRFKTEKKQPGLITVYKYMEGPYFTFLLNKSTCQINGLSFQQKKWHKIDCTWASGTMTAYVDGEKASSTQYDQAAIGKLEEGRILINPILWQEKKDNIPLESYEDLTLIDDIKIYSRALFAGEIQKNFLKDSGEKASNAKISTIEVSGIDSGNGKIDSARLSIDLNAIPTEWIDTLRSNKGEVTIVVSDGKEILFSEKDNTLKSLHVERIIKGIPLPKTTISVSVTLKDNISDKTISLNEKILKPDTSWLHNNFGKEDFVPQPWSPMNIDKNTVNTWNRTYIFNGPFIEKAISGGNELLQEPVKLLINGTEASFGTPQVTEKRNDYLIFEGSGNAEDIKIKYKNTVWFDGFSRIEFSIGPKGTKINSMKVKYAVKSEFSKYLTTPLYNKFEEKGNFFDWKGNSIYDFSTIWLMGDVDGFCWVPENEGNWAYSKDSKPIHVYHRKNETEVELNIISEPVILPEDVKYSFGFIATPTRPLPKDFRTIRWSSTQPPSALPVGWWGQTFEMNCSLIPGKTYRKDLEIFKMKGYLAFPYSSPTGLSDKEAVVKYFYDSWIVPKEAVFPAKHKDEKGELADFMQVPLAPTKAFCDFFADKVETYLSRKENEIGGLYYDLVYPFHNTSRNSYGSFTDSFGRQIPYQITTIGIRECLMRTVKICRKYNKRLVNHGHVVYNPAIHGLGDFWYPGEHLTGKLAKNPYYYTDEMPQEVYETEFNPHQKGVGVINLPVISRIDSKYSGIAGFEPTIGMLGRMILNDIISSPGQCYSTSVEQMLAIRNRIYGDKLNKAEFIRFNNNKNYTSTNKNIVVSFYVLSEEKTLAVICNLSKDIQKAEITFPGYNSAYDIWYDRAMKMENGSLPINMLGRWYMLVELKKK
ncbi:MAG: hypothetical protein A2020_14500 [Lentisphaerae bacterium GWF2_45_14]|nr:MAG: hypothetical protein A2020_14500 [Lentisphaerae bacterium GWF2_45_14]